MYKSSLVAVLLTASVLPTPQARAQTLTVLYSFSGGEDGANPFAGLIMDRDGNLYGTTTGGGSSRAGTVFKVDRSGNETVLHSFAGPDGAVPLAGLVMDRDGNLYGTTAFGGSSFIDNVIDSGNGTVFKVDTQGNETVLHRFMNVPDGVEPSAGLIMDRDGNLYGTTTGGGASGGGTVFEVDRSGNETVLHSFAGPDGADPFGSLLMDRDGNLYGTTAGGGSSTWGTVFKLDTSGKETVLHNFTNTPDGAAPRAGLVRGKEGNLYGTTIVGGSSGYGTVFTVDRFGDETVLHSFSGVDGAVPFADLIIDRHGNLYGTTTFGGSMFVANVFNGFGTVFKVDTRGRDRKETAPQWLPIGREMVVHSFSGAEGGSPEAGLITDREGNLYGTTAFFGTFDFGTVFKLDCKHHPGEDNGEAAELGFGIGCPAHSFGD
ncbi:MAG TPA: choice-of-anchor tandem repeat GloVer-containing protein [Terriglobales bacterium]|nr:choice-of-anchor tandem repeat GloVer-containing protein [Terriglobales bacterium]